MKRLHFLMTAVAAFMAMRALPAATPSPTALTISPAVELEFPTELGKTYQLQGAVNLTNWTDIGSKVYGHGRSVSRIFSTKGSGAVTYAAYRVQVGDATTNGFAPWSLSGARIQMDDHSSNNVVEFTNDDHGRDSYAGAPDPFTYEFTRVSDNLAQIDRTFTADRRELLTYSYTAPGLGTWVREEYRQGSFERRVLGVFRYLADTTNQIPGVSLPPVPILGVQPPAPPNVLTGLVYHVMSGSRPDELRFTTPTSGIEMPSPATSTDENESEVSPGGNTFTYTHQVLSTNTASLIVNFGYYGFGGDKNEYDLTYTDGPSGTFVRRIYRLGVLYSTDTGAFSPFAALPPTSGGTNPPPVIAAEPPKNPAGLTFTLHDDSTPSRLVFQSTAAGILFDDSAPDAFTYTYTATGALTYKLRVEYKADRWDEIDLTFVNGGQGSLVRRQFKSGKLDRTRSGTFTVAPTGN